MIRINFLIKNKKTKTQNMKYFKMICLILFFTSYYHLHAQFKKNKSKVIVSLKINEGKINGTDISQQLLEQNANFIFYKSLDRNEIMLCNYWDKLKTQSYGSINSVVREINLDTQHVIETFHFQWNYTNTYEDVKGKASAKLVIVHMGKDNYYYELLLFTNFIDVLLYSGTFKGNLALLH